MGQLTAPNRKIIEEDLEHILEQTKDLWDEFRGQNIFITGGTGFFGSWILETFAYTNEKLRLGSRALVLTRNPDRFSQKAPHLARNTSIKFLRGDVRTFEFPEGGFSHVIHAATESSTRLNSEDPLTMLQVLCDGTRHVLDFSVKCGTTRFLLVSSGAVYGVQPSHLSHLPEEYSGSPDTMNAESAYGEGKRISELLGAVYAKRYGINVKVARCFAFVGPYLPLNAHFAIGNFIDDVLNNRAVTVKGDGCPFRSYMYISDLMIWLWTILSRGKACHPYNVGSDKEYSISEIAEMVSRVRNPQMPINIMKKRNVGTPVQRYVPSIDRAKAELGLIPLVDLPTAISRTYEWAKEIKSSGSMLTDERMKMTPH